MRTIWKFPMPLRPRATVNMPANAEVLTVQTQPSEDGRGEQLCLWALVESESEPQERHFAIIVTGELCELRHGKYIGTIQLHEGRFVGHVFETL